MGTVANLVVRVSANVDDFEKQISSLEKSLDRTGSRMQSVGTKLTAGLTLPIVAVAGASIKAAMDFEDAFSGVAKTVDGVADSKGKLTDFGKQLQQDFRNLAKTIPVSVNELAKIGEVAGAMGIPKDKILDFSTVMAKLGATTNVTSDEAAASIGKIQNVYRSAGVDTDRFGAALVDLGNKGASTEAQILAFSERMAGAGVNANISQAEILGWANALASVGLQAELGSTAWNKVVQSMGKAVDLGGDRLTNFAAVASQAGEKMNTEQFSKLFKEDASEAMNRFVEGLGRIKQEGGNTTAVMEALGMKTSGIQMTFNNLAASGDLLRKSLETGKKAWQDNNALNEEFSKKAATTSSILKVLFNNLYDVGISLGQQLIPAFMRLLPAAQSVVQMLVGMVNWFSHLPQPIQTTAIALVAVVAAVGPIVYVFGTLLRAGGAVAQMFNLLGGARLLEALAPSANAARMSVTSLGSALLGIPYLGIAAGVAGIAVALGYVAVKAREAVHEFGAIETSKAWMKTAGMMMFGMGSTTLGQSAPRTRGTDINLPIEADPVAAFIKQTEDAQAFQKKAAALRPDLFPSFDMGDLKTGPKKKTAAEREAEAYRKSLDDLSGRTAIDVADEWFKKIKDIGGVTKLAAKDQEAFNNALSDALDAMIRLNNAVDPRVFNEWVKTMKVQATVGLPGELPGKALPLPAATGYYSNLMPQAVQGLPGGLPGTSASMANINPLKDVGFFAQAFGTGKQFGQQLGDALLGGIQGGWKGIVGSIGSMLGGNIGSQLGGMLGKMGGMLGGLFGSVMGPLGSMLGGLIGPLMGKVAKMFGKGDDGDKQRDEFLKSMGGYTALAERLHHELGAEGDRLFGVLRSVNSADAMKIAAEEITAALEKHAEAIKAASEGLPAAVNSRATNISSQADFSTVGAEAMGSFQFLVSQGQSAIQAFTAIAPAVTAMRDAMAANNFEVSAGAQRLFELGAILDANKIQFENIAASGSILSLMTQANIKDFDLFSAAALDVGANLQKIIDNGTPTAQALALAQPQLQALWEAQQKFGFETDEATQALIDQAVTQGIVGQNMKDVNQKILDVLLLIGDALGAKIPEALRGLPAVAGAAADGMNAAFSRVRAPSYDVSGAGEGGLAPMRSSNIEGGSSSGQGDVYLDGELVGRVMLPSLTAEAQRLGVS